MHEFWDTRYRLEGPIWGNQPSLLALRLAEKLPENSQILELGCGYGRDLTFLASKGHTTHGIERSKTALDILERSLSTVNISGSVSLFNNDFEYLRSLSYHYDAIILHRVFHLLTGDEQTSLVEIIHERLKPSSLLALSARSDDDYDTKSMRRIDAFAAEYTLEGREGQRITFANEASLEQTFGRLFDKLDFFRFSEVEAQTDSRTASTELIGMFATSLS